MIRYFKPILWLGLIAYFSISMLFTSCSQDSTSSLNDTSLVLLYSQNEFLMDVSNDTAGYYYKDTIWAYRDVTLKNIRATFSAEVDSLSSECNIGFIMYYFIDSVHQHIYTYTQFDRDSINRVHQVDLFVEQFRNYLLYYQFQLSINKETNYSPAFIRFRDIKIYKVEF